MKLTSRTSRIVCLSGTVVLLFLQTAMVQSVYAQEATASAVSTPQAVLMLPRWQTNPDLKVQWAVAIPQPNSTIDLDRLKSVVMSERVAEARRIVLLSQFAVVPGRAEALELLLDYVEAPSGNRMAKFAFVSAAVRLSGGSQQARLWAAVESDPAQRLVVEEALVGWNSPLALQKWRSRIQNPSSEDAALMVAINGIRSLGGPEDQAALQEILRSSWASISAKLASARALGACVEQGGEGLARELLDSQFVQRELLAANVLLSHVTDEADVLRKEILKSQNTAAHSVAFDGQVRSKSSDIRKYAIGLLSHPDSTVRLQAVDVLVEFDDVAALQSLGRALSDANPTVRRTVRERIIIRARQDGSAMEFAGKAAKYFLGGDSAVGAEQAIVLAVELGLKDRCMQMVQALEHPDPRLYVRAAWGLQELADSPEVLAAAMPVAEKITKHLETSSTQNVNRTELVRTSFLLCAFGRNRYQPANEMLLKYVPKQEHRMRSMTRSAAIWALGNIWQGRGNKDLAYQIGERMLDGLSQDPELPTVRYSAALALGLMQEPSSDEQLGQVMDDATSPLGAAAIWARSQLGKSE